MKIGHITLLLLILLPITCQASQEQSVFVTMTPLKKTTITSNLECYGTVHFDQRKATAIDFQRKGIVIRLLVNLGQVVQQGDPLLEFQTAPSETLAYEQALRAEQYAKKVEERWKMLLKEKATTPEQYDTVHKQWADALDALQAERTRGTQTDVQKVEAPFDGIVTSINVKQGDFVPAGTAILQLTREGQLLASLGVEPEDIHSVKVGMPVRITSVFDKTQFLDGQVIAIYGIIDPKTRLVNVVATVGGTPWQYFLPGMQVLGEIVLASSPSWVVPRQAVLTDAQGAYLFQVDKGLARLVRVKVTGENGNLTGIAGDLHPDWPVVIAGNYELRDGMAVREGKP